VQHIPAELGPIGCALQSVLFRWLQKTTTGQAVITHSARLASPRLAEQKKVAKEERAPFDTIEQAGGQLVVDDHHSIVAAIGSGESLKVNAIRQREE
jgi:hypothetical protein